MLSSVFFNFSSATSPRETVQRRAIFFLRPMLVPSGVSIGQSLPQCVGCNARASKFSCVDVNNELTLRRCEYADKMLLRSMFWLIPFLPPVQLPVASALL